MMTRKAIPSMIVDRNGRPAMYYEVSRQQPGDRTFITQGQSPTDEWKQLDGGTLSKLQGAGRFLYKNCAILRGAVLEKASLSFPLEPQFTGADKEWGSAAEAWLYDWHKVFCVAGETYDFDSACRIIQINETVDGDIGTVLRKTSSNYPQVQFIRGHRINARDWSQERFRNGVQTTRDGKPVAYSVLGETDADDVIIPANDFILTYRPDMPDQLRGVSKLCASIVDFADVKRLRQYEMRAQMMLASQALIEKNETGEADTAAEAISMPTTDGSGTPTGLVTQLYEGGMVRYYRSNSGSGLEAFRGGDRPSMSAQAFEDRIVTGALYAMEWDPNFALAIKEPGGAYARTVIEKIRRSVANGQKVVKKWARRVDGWALSVAMKNGDLPYPSDGDWYSWDYQGPARITADTGNEQNARREGYKLGMTTLKSEQAEGGNWWEETRAQRSVEIDDLLTRAQATATKFGISIQEALTLYEQRSPNPMPSPTEPAPTGAQP